MLSASAAAAGVPGETEITGVVTENHIAAPNATVIVECNGNLRTDTTDAMGSYLATYPTAQCPFGSTVRVTATKNGHSGTRTGTVQGITTKLNLAIVNVEVPEYGLIGTLAAGGAGVGLIAYRRRQMRTTSTK